MWGRLSTIGPNRRVTLDPIKAGLRVADFSTIRGIVRSWTPLECFTDSGGTTAPTNGQEILRANDVIGGTPINATATATNGLVYSATGLNGHPGWYCAGGADKLTATSAVVAGMASAFSTYVVVSCTIAAADSITCPIGGAWGYLARKWRDASDWRSETTGTTDTSADLATANSEPVTNLAVLWTTWDGTTKRVGLNGIYAEETPGGTFTPTGNMTIGNANSGSFGYTDPFGRVVLCQAAHTLAEVKATIAMMLQEVGVHSTVVLDGDSLLTGFGLTNGKVATGVRAKLDTRMSYATVQSPAIGGNDMADLLGDDDTTVGRALIPWHEDNYACIWAGTNDVDASRTASDIYDDIVTWAAAQQALGFQVIVGTIISRNYSAAKQLVADNVNALIRANTPDTFDAVADLALRAELSDYTDTDYFQGDGIHLTEDGADIAAEVWQQAIERLRRASA